MYKLKKLTRLYETVMMIKDYRLLIELQHILMDTNTRKVCKRKMLNKVNIND